MNPELLPIRARHLNIHKEFSIFILFNLTIGISDHRTMLLCIWILFSCFAFQSFKVHVFMCLNIRSLQRSYVTIPYVFLRAAELTVYLGLLAYEFVVSVLI